MDYGDDEFAAICRDPHQICDRVPLLRRDVLLQELDVGSFAGMVAGPLGIRLQEPVVSRGDGVWGIGISKRRDTSTRPVFLALLPDTARFVAITHRLLLGVPGPFVLLAPTSRHLTIEVQGMLQQRGVSFLSLEEHLMLDESGRLVAIDSGTSPPGCLSLQRKIAHAW